MQEATSYASFRTWAGRRAAVKRHDAAGAFLTTPVDYRTLFHDAQILPIIAATHISISESISRD
jgi:hypothetical protein